MKAFKIERGGVTEIDLNFDEMLEGEICWDCTDLDASHDIWVNDDGLSIPGVTFAKIGIKSNIPLPAYVMGAEGERTVDATLDISELRAMVLIQE